MRDDASELLLSTLILVLILSRMMLIVIIIMAIMLKMVGALHALVNLSKVLDILERGENQKIAM